MDGVEIVEILQNVDNPGFGLADLRSGCEEGVDEEVAAEHAMDMKREGKMISSAFTVVAE